MACRVSKHAKCVEKKWSQCIYRQSDRGHDLWYRPIVFTTNTCIWWFVQ